MEHWEICAWGSWVAPVVGALLTPLLAKAGKRARDYGAVFFSFLSVVATVQLIPLLFAGAEWPLRSKISWIVIPGAPVLGELEAGMLLDPLSIVMANVVSIVSFLIMVYSLDYMHGDPGLTRYWFFMNFFIGNMLLLVLSDNLVQMLFGWEGVGLCSYALIGYWYRDSKEDWLKCWVGEPPEAYPPSHCGLKAFLVTRFGDLLMLAGMLMILALAGTLDFVELGGAVSRVPEHSAWLLAPALVLLLGGAIGKSAQLPLMEWLPDAMAGPTSVSALIHAATMVKAGVYLVARMFPIAYSWSLVLPEVSVFFTAALWIGAITAFVAATQAVVSTELKKVLAYSTVSQLGYMMMALGAGGLASEFVLGYAGGLFHVMNHAMFKAALFMAAGSVIHACGSRFLRDMGGLKRHMPVTFYSMLIAALALMGVPPLGGFWSKDAVLEAALVAGQYAPFAIGVITAALTAFYSLRMIGLTFLGEESPSLKEKEEKGHHVHEAPARMWLPYAALVAGTVGIGLAGPLFKSGLEEVLGTYLEHLVAHASHHSPGGMEVLITTACSLGALLLGAVPAYLLYVKRTIRPEAIVEKSALLRGLRTFLFRRYYINALYYKAFVNPAISGSRIVLKSLELGVIDRANYLVAAGVRAFSSAFRKTHTGLLNHYVIAVIAGLLLIVLLLIAG